MENIQRFKTKLAALKRSRRFIRWDESAGFARELQDLLQDLKIGVSDPKQGAELVAAFYEADKGTLGNRDDSKKPSTFRKIAPSLVTKCLLSSWWRLVKPPVFFHFQRYRV